MLSSTFALAPAGVLGSGSEVVRPYACAAVSVVEGIRVPSAGMARRRTAGDPVGFLGAFAATGLPIGTQHDPISKNDGTTPLGIHPRGRSTS